MSKKNVNKKLNLRMIFSLIVNILLVLSTIFLISYILKLNGIENILRILFSIIVSICVLLLAIFNFKTSKKKKSLKHKFLLFISILTIVINCFLSYSLSKVFNTLNKISNNSGIVSVSLVTLKSNNISDIYKISSEDKIASISEEVSPSLNELVLEFNVQNGLKNKLVYYDTYFEIAESLLDGNIKYAFLPSEYQTILSSQEEYSDFSEKINIVKSYEKTQKLEVSAQKSVLEPFTVLLMGVDTLTSSYNADTLMVVTFNPETLSATMLSIPRDTYTTISCTGKKHKINSSGWSGDKCVVSTVEKYLDVEIDYYAKINFKGVVELVNALGGIEVDVPYSFCEQNSQRKWGKKTVYVEKGLQTLNGEQALALTRNRHYWKGRCDSKYTKEGNRSDFTRGQNQQLVLKSMLNSMKKIDNINTVYKLLDTLGDNMVTSMSTDTILSLYNVGKDIILKMNTTKDVSKIVNIQRLKFTSYTQTIKIGNLNLSTVINHDNSVKEVTTAMKTNLGLIESKTIKTFGFDINTSYKENVVGAGTYGGSSNIVVLPNFVGKDYNYAKSWTLTNDVTLKIEYKYTLNSSYEEGEVIKQSSKANTDVSTIKELTITVATKVNNESHEEEGPANQFTYNQCLQPETKDLNQCIIQSFVGKDIETFKNWLNSTGLNLSVQYNTVEGVNTNIIGQNITGLSIYDLVNQGKTLEITYSKKGEPVIEDKKEEIEEEQKKEEINDAN